MARGFYSVVQYCPDRFRAEAVNVGLVLLCLDPHGLRVETIGRYDRVRRLFGIGGAELKNVNLVKPHVFPENRRAETQAATLALDGDLIKKYPIHGERQALIVVSTQETGRQAKEIDDHVAPLFREYGVRLIRPAGADAFASEVEKSAQ